MITLFKNIKDTNTPFYVTDGFIFDKIKTGAVQKMVEQVRSEQDSEQRNILKSKLPAICFSGEFNHRSKGGFKKHSGFICLDFDHFPSQDALQSHRDVLLQCEYTYALFLSPSGDGLKMVVRIPDSCTVDEHVQYYVAMCDFLSIENLDSKTKDIARACYMSYDPDIYINEQATVWTTKEEYEQKSYHYEPPVLALSDSSKIMDQLRKWWDKKFDMTAGSRNANLYVLAASFNEYGVPQSEALNYCLQFQQQDFSVNEITGVVRSAYSNRSAHGTKFFNDADTIKTIKQMSKSGHSKKDIHNKLQYKRIPKAELDDAIETIEKDMSSSIFWTTTEKGSVVLNNNDLRNWCMYHGFYKYYTPGGQSYIFVRMENNLVDNVTNVKIKDYVMDYLLNNEHYKAFELLAPRTNFFSDQYLNLLPNLNVTFKRDTKDTCYLYFRNKAIEVTKDNITEVDYIDLDGFVWRRHLIDSEFNKVDYTGCDFERFIFNVAGKDKQRELSIKSTIGYLLHSYKDSASNFAVVLNDETISENPTGGTGKGIIINAISKLKRSAILDGKSFSFDNSFPFQTVGIDTQVLCFDDVKKSFDFERLFSVITEGITIEKKGKDAFILKREDSPKILISTNYTIAGDSTSFARRKWDVELAQHYNLKNTPLKEFGRLLFDDWDKEEWHRFYSYMVSCIQLFLAEGIIKTDFTNSKLRQFIASTCTEFAEWIEDNNIKLGERVNKATIHEQFIKEYPDRKQIHQKTFNKWVKAYAQYKDLDYTEGNSNGSRWLCVGKDYSFLEVEQPEAAPF